ncbi:hypothetical protein [Pedobacter changchengzhani]|uniref:hypothetical protein n=1 Tax=Pedobacter changchengzhani TaxID=2529274 RepID=UPI0014047502|nr:hypothetical protein [Pedobacter changchengzhani]
MIIKLDTSLFRLSRDFSIENTKKIAQPSTIQERIIVDRIVVGALFLITIVGTILFQYL